MQKNGYTFAIVYSSKCVSVFLHKTLAMIFVLLLDTNGYFKQGIPIVTLYSNLSILVGKISSVFLQILEYLLTDQGFESPSQS